jgi:2,3-bisphosphoglycerate-independent phosphoglycerate mutase
VTYIEQLQEVIKNLGYGGIATASGRYYAMDRDKRWERIQVAYDALVSGEGEESSDFLKTVNERYQKDETDEFLKPIILNKHGVIGGEFCCYHSSLGAFFLFFDDFIR